MDQYFNRYEVSNSDLTKLMKYFYGAEYQPEPTEAYRFGTLLDAIATEPEKVNYFLYTVDGEQYTKDEFALAEDMKRALRADQFYREMTTSDHFIKDKIEYQKVFSDPAFKVFYGDFLFTLPVRCKYDIWFNYLGWGGDLKTTTATTQKQFEEACRHFGYDRQRAWYMDISGSSRDILIGVSKVNLKVFKLPITRDSEFYQSGRQQYSDLAFKYWSLYMEFFKDVA